MAPTTFFKSIDQGKQNNKIMLNNEVLILNHGDEITPFKMCSLFPFGKERLLELQHNTIT